MNSGIQHILLDIEGTTCPVSFVSEVLFPYAERKLAGFLEQHGKDPAIQPLLQDLQLAWQKEEDPEAIELLQRCRREQSEAPGEAGSKDIGKAETGKHDATTQPQTLLPYLHWLIRRDRKVTAWKDMQGLIWRDGYARREIKAELFSDVLPTLRQWKQSGLELSVYSSGSVEAQKLLYGHCQEGDVRELFSHWFDTRIGAKQDAQSYQQILEILCCNGEQVLFISDVTAELQAAQAVGMQVVFSNREGNPYRDPEGFRSISRLDQLWSWRPESRA